LKLFLISYLVFLLELAYIRWLSAYVLYLGYFTNFVLLAALLGIGAGTLLAGRSSQLMRWLPALLFSLLCITLFTRAQVNPEFEGLVFFTSTQESLRLSPGLMLSIVFVVVSVTFTSLAQDLGRYLTEFPPLKAYTINILGSLVGIASFTLLSFLGWPAWTWFLVVTIVLLPFLPKDRLLGINRVFLLGAVLVVAASDRSLHNTWSPYYRLNLLVFEGRDASLVGSHAVRDEGAGYLLLANGAGHQEFTAVPVSKPFYALPYESLKPGDRFENALIVGAGGGNDVAVALASGVDRVDAVEIDPRIVDMGKSYHPANPYHDPRVEIHVEDARSFMERSNQEYDLIVFALPDSLVLATNMSSLRLESFLFTIEAFEAVQRLLSSDGLFVLYNYYRSDWLVSKIASMAEAVFGQAPIVYRVPDPEYEELEFAVVFVGPGIRKLSIPQAGEPLGQMPRLPPATDNWPFLYLREPSIPLDYALALVPMLVFSVLYIRKLSPSGAIAGSGLPFFFMGAAFMLLEAKSLVQFLLLFGSTWLVNALVFFAILLVVLLAIWFAARWRFTRLWILYLLLLAALVLNFLLPLQRIHFESVVLRYLAATALLFSPIFLANVIYSALFRDAKQANLAFGANLLGTMVGGALEYVALLTGYHNLIIVAGLLYFLAFRSAVRARRSSPLVTA
jgi:hypothetical protein